MVNGFDSLELLDKKLRHQVSVHFGHFRGGEGFRQRRTFKDSFSVLFYF